LNEISLDLSPYDLFNADYCFTSGQIFGWKKINGYWYGVTKCKLLKIYQKENTLLIDSEDDIKEKEVVDFLRLEDHKNDIDRKIALNQFMSGAISRFSAVRILKQDPAETIISYICAQNKNIPAIEKMIYELSRMFGFKKEMDSISFYTLPNFSKISNLCLKDLLTAGLGYRAKYLLETGRRIQGDNTLIDEIANMEYHEAWKKMAFGEMKLSGVGPKVADCILLYGFGKMEAFPIDIWISRTYATAMEGLIDDENLDFFRNMIYAKKNPGKRLYLELGDSARKVFGKYAGYAQLYMYMYRRNYFRYL